MLDQDIIFRLVLSLLLIITGAGTAAALIVASATAALVVASAAAALIIAGTCAALIIAGTCAALIIAGAGIIRVSACRLICIITGVITGVVAGVAGVIAGVAGVAALGTRIIILIRLGLMLLHKTDGLGNISRLGHIH